MRLAAQNNVEIQDRGQFSAIAARVMRQILIDHARRRNAQKRGGGAPRIMVDALDELASTNPDLDVVELDDLLTKLEQFNPRHARVIEMRFFAGMSVPETAEALGISETTIKADWQMARSWLQAQLKRGCH